MHIKWYSRFIGLIFIYFYFILLHYKLSHTFRIDVMKTDRPISTKIMSPVTLCSRMPKNLGCSPGAEHSDSTFKLLTWEMERTVAATNQGKPITEHTPSITATTRRSRWYPPPFCRRTESWTPGPLQCSDRLDQVLNWPWACVLYGWWWQRWSADPWRWGWCTGGQGWLLQTTSMWGYHPEVRSASHGS